MCRGCHIFKQGEPTVSEYLNWLDAYHDIHQRMKSLEKILLAYQSALDSQDDSKRIDGFRRRLTRLRKEYTKAEGMLDD